MSVADDVKQYVAKRPYIQEALAHEIVNYSALARHVQDKVNGGFQAVKMALRRHSKKLQEQHEHRITNVAEILSGTNIELKSKLQVCRSDTEQDGEVTAKTEHGHTAIQDTDQTCTGEVIDDQVMITLKSPQDLEEVPGVLAFILDLLAGNDVNVTECISCREDTHIVIHEDDTTEAFTLLNEKLQ